MPSGGRLRRAWSGTSFLDEEFIPDVIVVARSLYMLKVPLGSSRLLKFKAKPLCCGGRAICRGVADFAYDRTLGEVQLTLVRA